MSALLWIGGLIVFAAAIWALDSWAERIEKREQTEAWLERERRIAEGRRRAIEEAERQASRRRDR